MILLFVIITTTHTCNTGNYFDIPSKKPSTIPSQWPSKFPSQFPSNFPSQFPSGLPSESPSELPTKPPSSEPTISPSLIPTLIPSSSPIKPLTTQIRTSNTPELTKNQASENSSQGLSLTDDVAISIIVILTLIIISLVIFFTIFYVRSMTSMMHEITNQVDDFEPLT